MKILNKTILIALGMTLPLTVMASPGDDVTIRMMEMNEQAAGAVTSHIELPAAADHARENAADGIETSGKSSDGEHDEMDNENEHSSDSADSPEHEADREEDHDRELDKEDERDSEIDREEDHEREMDAERDDRKDVEHDGVDREEVEQEGVDVIDHGGDNVTPEVETPVL